jgi:hypothetical protein
MSDDVDTGDFEDGEDGEEFIPVAVVMSAGKVEPPGETASTVLDRLLAAGIGHDRAVTWLAAGAVQVDGEPTTDPSTPAAPPARVVLLPT